MFFFFQAEDGIRDGRVTGVQTCALPILAALSTGLAALALLLGSIGVYAMASYRVSRCVREIGIRMALGADGSEVMSPVLRPAMRPVLLGGLAGVAGCAAVSRVLSNMLFGVSAYDPIAFQIEKRWVSFRRLRIPGANHLAANGRRLAKVLFRL